MSSKTKTAFAVVALAVLCSAFALAFMAVPKLVVKVQARRPTPTYTTYGTVRQAMVEYHHYPVDAGRTAVMFDADDGSSMEFEVQRTDVRFWPGERIKMTYEAEEYLPFCPNDDRPIYRVLLLERLK